MSKLKLKLQYKDWSFGSYIDDTVSYNSKTSLMKQVRKWKRVMKILSMNINTIEKHLQNRAKSKKIRGE
jgi:hypothetical protein